jgi:hypothetical protein
MSLDLEQELATRLRRRGSAAPVGPGWEGIHRRIDGRRRSRQRRLVGGGAAVLVAAVAVSAALVGPDPDARVASQPPDAAPPAPALPRLVLDLPGWAVTHASSDETGRARAEGAPLWVLAEPDRGYDGKAVFVSVVPPSVPFGIGEESPTAAVVDVRGRRAYLNLTPPLSGQLGWKLDDGTAVYITSTRLSGEELVAVGRALDVAPDRTLVVPPGPLPGGVRLLRATSPGEWDGRMAAEVAYRRGEAAVDVRLQTGGAWMLDELVRDRLVSARSARAVTVAGVPGVLTTYAQPGESHSLLWPVRSGVVVEVRADGVPADEALAAAQSLEEIDEEAWRELLARFAAATPTGDDAEGPGRHEKVAATLCELRAAWLAASGSDRARSDALDRLGELRATAVAEGLDRDSDIVVVIDDLVAAMAAGDADAVRSIPGGGCP